ncbi:calcium/sodium antiporter [Candidatus Saccharibacteria bacterium]|nr:calcium/sodium antiporter [Candidatus Saccharibacteria bacterium]
MFLNIVFLLAGFVALIFGADFLVKGAASIAKKFHISTLVIGLTVVAFGTSMPELTVGVTAALRNSTDIVLGNVIGSNIANILLILGICALVQPLIVKSTTVWKEIPLALAGMGLIFVEANDSLFDNIPSNAITRTDGVSLLVLFVIFMYYIFGLARNDRDAKANAESTKIQTYSTSLSVVYAFIGFGLLVLGGSLLVDNAVGIAEKAGLSQSLIGLTVVAIGTSLPELATSLIATIKGQNDIAIGNVIGSNIFNTFWILGASSSVAPLPVAANGSIDIAVGVAATLGLFIFMFVNGRHRLNRIEGLVFVLAYFAYMGFLIKQG